MKNELAAMQSGLRQFEDQKALARCNALSARYGLTLTPAQMLSLSEAHCVALRENGRMEFGCGILEKLVYAFCDSPYIQQDDYAGTLAALQDTFYYFKGEAMERLSDDELISSMKTVFDGAAQGSVDYLAGTSLELLCRMARTGGDWDEMGDRPVLSPDWDDAEYGGR